MIVDLFIDFVNDVFFYDVSLGDPWNKRELLSSAITLNIAIYELTKKYG